MTASNKPHYKHHLIRKTLSTPAADGSSGTVKVKCLLSTELTHPSIFRAKRFAEDYPSDKAVNAGLHPGQFKAAERLGQSLFWMHRYSLADYGHNVAAAAVHSLRI